MALLLYVHHIMAAVVNIYPNGPSMGTTMPINDVRTSGRRQYPSTDAERGNVRVEEKCDEVVGCAGWPDALAVAGSTGGDIRDRIMWSEVLPSSARP